MPKLKTHKATAKRFKVSRSGKIIKRTCGQDHFNARESGKVRRAKRSDVVMSQSLRKVMEKNLPHA